MGWTATKTQQVAVCASQRGWLRGKGGGTGTSTGSSPETSQTPTLFLRHGANLGGTKRVCVICPGVFRRGPLGDLTVAASLQPAANQGRARGLCSHCRVGRVAMAGGPAISRPWVHDWADAI